MNNRHPPATPQTLCTFAVDGAWFGVDILRVQEVNRLTALSPVPLAGPQVLGVMNLRGRVVTVLDLGRLLGLAPSAHTPESRNVVVQSRGDAVALWVDEIADVVTADTVAPAPANLRAVRPGCLAGVVQAPQGLVAILDLDELLRVEGEPGTPGRAP